MSQSGKLGFRHAVRMWLLRIANGVPAPVGQISATGQRRQLPPGRSNPLNPHRESLALDASGLAEYRLAIDRFNQSQGNCALLEDIRTYNHQIVTELNKIVPLAGREILDIGASPHGYALEKCVELGALSYTGIGLDIDAPESWQLDQCAASLMHMNAQKLEFADDTFDLIVSMSTFEHIADVPMALSEISRVLRPGGTVLLSFEPLWTCAYGHHLHQYSELSALVPSWAHLIWDRHQMREQLEKTWPIAKELSLDEAIAWIYDEPVINRVSIDQMRAYFRESSLAVEWIIPMADGRDDPIQLELAIAATGLPAEDLKAKGLSVLMRQKEQAGPA